MLVFLLPLANGFMKKFNDFSDLLSTTLILSWSPFMILDLVVEVIIEVFMRFLSKTKFDI